jgi:hypothetical protein
MRPDMINLFYQQCSPLSADLNLRVIGKRGWQRGNVRFFRGKSDEQYCVNGLDCRGNKVATQHFGVETSVLYELLTRREVDGVTKK